MKTANPLRALLHEAIDYAGLFPPAGLDMAAAVRNYSSYLAGEYSWMLGRFVVAAGRIDEFERAAARYLAEHEWKVAILGKPDRPPQGRGFAVDAIELRAERIKDIAPVFSLDTYFEVPPAIPVATAIESIGRAHARAKIRTGGLTAEAFPETSRVAHFLALCQRAKVAFKATAGLHHPVRGVHPFTYDPGSATGVMQGFLNLFLAAALLFAGGSEQEASEILEESSPNAFRFDDQGAYWRSWQISREQIQNARTNFAISFGSCSFEEPVRELAGLGLL
jgi:hypothetical protein